MNHEFSYTTGCTRMTFTGLFASGDTAGFLVNRHRTLLLARILAMSACLSTWASGVGPPSELTRSYSGQFPLPISVKIDKETSIRLVGRIANADGKPIRDGRLSVLVAFNTSLFRTDPRQLVERLVDREGRFDFEFRTPPYYQCESVFAIAGAPGYGMQVLRIDAAAKHQELAFTLSEEQPIRGQLVDVNGLPARGVRLQLQQAQPVGAWEYPARLPEGSAPSFWPADIVTDQNGRFVLNNVLGTPDHGSAVSLRFNVHDERYAPELVFRLAGGAQAAKHAIESSRVVRGQVTARDTGLPIAGAWLLVVLDDNSFAKSGGDAQWYGVKTKTDEEGRFRARCSPGDWLCIYVYPPRETPYPAWVHAGEAWPSDEQEKEVNVSLERGQLIRGKIVDSGSGQGIGGAGVEYRPSYFEDRSLYWAAEYRRILSEPDGSFAIAVGNELRGHLLVKAPSPDYVSQFVTAGELEGDEPDGAHYCFEGLHRLVENSHGDVTISLRRGFSVPLWISGPNGEEVKQGVMLSPNFLYPEMAFAPHRPVPIRDGYVLVRGVEPEKPMSVYILDSSNQWGATVRLTKEDERGKKVKLGPCGSASVRILNSRGDAWPASQELRRFSRVSVAVTSVPPAPQKRFFVSAPGVSWSMRVLDRDNYSDFRTSEDGKVTFRSLIPDAPYRLYFSNSDCLGREFHVRAGELFNFPEVTLNAEARMK